MPFVQKPELAQVRHTVEVNLALQMVGFVLDDAGVKIVRGKVELLPIAAKCFNPQFLEARDQSAQLGNAETPFEFVSVLRSRIETSGFISTVRGTGGMSG